MKALGVGQGGAGDVRAGPGRPGPFGRHFTSESQGLGGALVEAQSPLGLCQKHCPRARLGALKAGTCTAAAGSGPASFGPLPAPAPSEASLPVRR